MKARALLVENDSSLRASTALLLEGIGIDVVGTATGEEALCALASGAPFDVVVLGVRLPGIDGFEVCRRMREWSTIPIVMLTARSNGGEVVAGLEAGADDCIAKPFDEAELLARVRAAIRRTRFTAIVRPWRFADLLVDPGAFRVEIRGRPLDLTATELRLLVELVRNAGSVVSREELLDRVWGCDYLGDSRLVDMAIKRLRAKLGDEAHDPRYIGTVRGVGYRFEQPLGRVAAL